MILSPIVLFVYNRPWHTGQVLNALGLNYLAEESVLYIYADGPKNNASAETVDNINKTRDLIKSKTWCKEVIIIESTENKGLQQSIISGVTDVVNKHGKVIVLEDDIITSKHFLQYMNDALRTYEAEEKVLSIGAFNFFATDSKVTDTFFVPIPDCWGWATWKNRWQLFEPDGQLLLNRLREQNLISKFNLEGAYNFEEMLIQQIKGQVSSWAVRWQALAYIEEKLTLYPRLSVTQNIGFDSSGTHAGNSKYLNNVKFADKRISVHPLDIKLDIRIEKKMIAGYRKINQPDVIGKAKHKIKKGVKNIVPNSVLHLYRKGRSVFKQEKADGMWSGNYPSWPDAVNNSIGYNDETVLNKCENALLQIKNNNAVYERDSVIFDKKQYSWPLLSALQNAAIENGFLHVLDFGGSLGSTYYQNKEFLTKIKPLSWGIVEQEQFVQRGKKVFENETLKFYYNIEERVEIQQPDVLLLSSVLQYLEDPYKWIHKMVGLGISTIIIDRTSFIAQAISRITVQNVPPNIYEASYPCWFFNEQEFLAAFADNYRLIADFDSFADPSRISDDEKQLYWKGFILKIKN